MKFNEWRKSHKKSFIASIVGAVVLVVLILAVCFAGVLVKVGGENIGPLVTGGPLKIGWASLNVFTGRIVMHNVVVGNPKGFTSKNIVIAKRIVVDADMRTIFNKKLTLEEVTVKGVEVYYEQHLTESNLSALQNNVANFQKKLGLSPDPKAKPKKLQVNKLSLTDINVNLVVSKAAAPMPIPSIELKDLGTDPEGITPVEVVGKVLDKLTAGVVSSLGASIKSLF